MIRAILRLYLHDHGEDMRNWGGKPIADHRHMNCKGKQSQQRVLQENSDSSFQQAAVGVDGLILSLRLTTSFLEN